MNYKPYLLDALNIVMNEPYADGLDGQTLGDAVVGMARGMCHLPGD